jgi:tRNA nucleotidyltransferase (CCA-adding enzyme)
MQEMGECQEIGWLDMEIITTHKNTDFDALASVFAARLLFPDAVAVLPGSLNPNVRNFLSIHKSHFPYTLVKDLDLREVTRLIVVDTGSWARLEGLEPLAGRGDLHITIIDHHVEPGDIHADESLSRPAGSATTLMMGFLGENEPVSPIQATLFIAGIYEDTGNLTFPSTTAEDARSAAFLLERGADLNLIRDLLRYAYSPAQKETLFALLSHDQRFRENGYEVSLGKMNIEGHSPGLSVVVDMYHDINGADATFGLFGEPRRDQCIVIGRSAPNTLDIGFIMQKMGGGGHPNAGSALLKSHDLEKAEQWLRELIRTGMKSPVQIADLMSFPVFTVSSDTSMKEAALLLREKGCTGLPVLEGEALLGIISRRDFRKARQSSQLRSPVKAFMSTKVICIEPDCGVTHAVRLMVNHDIGRLPVVQDGRLIGIVTRSDAMRYYYDLMPE